MQGENQEATKIVKIAETLPGVSSSLNDMKIGLA